MGRVISQPGKLIYVKYNPNLILPGTKIALVGPDSKDLWFLGDPKQLVVIPDDPVMITFVDEKFKSSDGAIAKVSLQITVVPKFDSGIEEVVRCVPAYIHEKESAEKGLDEKQPHKWLRPRLQGLMNKLGEFTFESLMDDQVIRNLPKQFDKLSSLIEQEAITILKEFNFGVVSGTCKITCEHYPQNELETNNPNHQPILKYIARFHPSHQELLQLAGSFEVAKQTLAGEYEKKRKEIEEEIKALGEKLEKESKTKREKHLEDIRSLTDQHEQKIAELEKKRKEEANKINDELAELDKNKEIADNQREQIKAKELGDIEVKKLDEQAQLAGQKTQATIKREEEELKIEIEKINRAVSIEERQISTQLTLRDKRQQLLSGVNKMPFSLEDLRQLQNLQAQLELQKARDTIIGIGISRQHQEEDRRNQIERSAAELAHKQKMDLRTTEFLVNLLQRLFEREILLAYSDLKAGEQREFLKNLGEQLSNIVKGGAGLIDSLRIINLSDGNAENPLTKLLSQLVATLLKASSFFPTINEIFNEFGIRQSPNSPDSEGAESTESRESTYSTQGATESPAQSQERNESARDSGATYDYPTGENDQ